MYEVDDLQACEPDELTLVAGIRVVIADELDSQGFPRATVIGPTRKAVLDYCGVNWGGSDDDWFQEWVVERVRPVDVTLLPRPQAEALAEAVRAALLDDPGEDELVSIEVRPVTDGTAAWGVTVGVIEVDGTEHASRLVVDALGVVLTIEEVN